MLIRYICIFLSCIFLTFWNVAYADEIENDAEIEIVSDDPLSEDIESFESDVVVESEDIVDVTTEDPVDISTEEPIVEIENPVVDEVIENNEVPSPDVTVDSESDSQINEQYTSSDSSSSSAGEIVVIDGETYIELVPYEGETVAHPENLEDVSRDSEGNIYIAPDDGNLQTRIDLYEDLLSTDGLKVFEGSYLDSDDLTDWDIADYFKAVVTQALFDIFGDPTEEDLEELEEEEYEPELADDSFFSIKGVIESPFLTPLRSSNRDGYKNVVVYHGWFNSEEVDLIIPYEQYKNLNMQSGILVNVSNNTVTGKFLYNNDPLDPSDYDSYTYILNPIYGSTSNVYNYGSFNYRRHYFLQSYTGGQRITSTDMYGNFSVDSVDVYYTNSERTYYAILFVLLFMGVNFLWNRRH